MPMPLRRRVGQVLIGSFTGYTVPVELVALAREFDLGGATLFARNVESPEQVLETAMAVEALGSASPGWVSVDQEGGRVARLKAPFTVWPPAATLGRSTDPSLAERFARALARELVAVGITLDFAPVLDVLTNAANPAIGDRALSADAARVASLGTTLIRVMQEEGLAACGKHFPGHGDTAVDSHFELPVVEHSPDRLRRVEFVPFRAAIAAEVACIMTAHLLVPALDEAQPATLSPGILALLRGELGYPGMVVSDDLEMQAIGKRWTPAEAAVAAIRAGCDTVLVCTGNVDVQASVLEALVKATETGALPLARLDDAVARVARQKARFLGKPRPPVRDRVRACRQTVGCETHQLVAAEMAAAG